MSGKILTSRLQQRWQEASTRKLVIFHAPGGFGKTTAAEWWVDQIGLPTIWLSLYGDPGCRHVPTFVTTIAAKACDTAIADQHTRIDSALAICHEAFPEGFSLVLDDYHEVASDALDGVLADLLARLREPSRLIITTRKAIQHESVRRLIARRQGVVINDCDLQLQAADIGTFLSLSPSAANDIHQRTGGWILALDLLRTAQEKQLDRGEVPYADHLEDYVFDELLVQCPDDVVHFMQITALMEQFTVADCEAIHLPEAEATLRHLDKDLRLLRREGDRLRYHALIRDALIARLERQDRMAWHARIAHHLLANDDEASIQHFINGGAWQDACRAIMWFQLTIWREINYYKPTLSYWYGQLPRDIPESAWSLILYVYRHDSELRNPERLAYNDRIMRLFAADDDRFGLAICLYQRARIALFDGDNETFARYIPDIQAMVASFPENHPAHTLGLDLIIFFHRTVVPNRHQWEQGLAQLLAQPPKTPLLCSLHFRNRLYASLAHHEWGEFRSAVYHWQHACKLISQVQEARCIPVGKQAVYATLLPIAEVFDNTVVSEVFAAEARDTYFAALITFYQAIAAWQHANWNLAAKHFVVLDALEPSLPNIYLAEYYTEARLRLGEILQRRGRLDEAQTYYHKAERNNRYPSMLDDIAWHKSWIALAVGDRSSAEALADAAEAHARALDHKFILAKTLLLRALIADCAPAAEVHDLVDQWEYRHALGHYFPEGLAWLDGSNASVHAVNQDHPRVRIYSLGGLRVEVDGQPIAWKRSNSQLILMDLLLHPEGSTGEEMELRYWRSTGNSSFRNDMQALRQALEPETPGKDSRYVSLSGRKYRWTMDESLFWWDVPEFRRLHLAAQAAEDETERRRYAKAALDLYRGPFVPEFESFQAFANQRRVLATAAEDLHRTLAGTNSASR